MALCLDNHMPHALRPEHRDKPFIIVSAFSISTLVKGPFTATMQRAVALRSYHHSLRVHSLPHTQSCVEASAVPAPPSVRARVALAIQRICGQYVRAA